MAIVFTSDFNNAVYYLQTASIIIVMVHAWIQPYKNDTQNVIDGLILIFMVMIVSLGSHAFVRSLNIIVLVILPLILLFSVFVYVSCTKFQKSWKDRNETQEIMLRYVIRQINLSLIYQHNYVS